MSRLGKTFFTADNLFGDEVAADQRGFRSPREMNEAMIDRWNGTVGTGDVVWVLGDFCTISSVVALDVTESLHGTKYLVSGPLDRPLPARVLGPDRIMQRAMFCRGLGFAAVVTGSGIGRKSGRPVTLPLRTRADNLATPVIVSHFPYDPTEAERGQPDRFTGWRPQRPRQGAAPWLLHGHCAEWGVKGEQINVGADVWDLEPVSTEMVLGLIEGAES